MDVENFGKNEIKNLYIFDFIINKYCCICVVMLICFNIRFFFRYFVWL